MTTVEEEAREGSLPAAYQNPEITADAGAHARASVALPSPTALVPVTQRARDAGRAAARMAGRTAEYNAAWIAEREAAWAVVRDAERDAAWAVARDASWAVARDAILALVAYDDCAYMLDSDPGELAILAAFGDPRAGLLLPACKALQSIKESA